MNNMHPVRLLKKMMPQDSARDQRSGIAVGDRYEQKDGPVSLWVVERISEVRMSRFPLVHLARVGHPDITKTVSLSALSSENEYRVSL